MLHRLGFFDSVRAEGDGEFECRTKILFGEDRIVNFPWPLCFGRVRPGSITASEDFGLIRGRGRPRPGGIPEGLQEVAREDRRRARWIHAVSTAR